MLTDISGQPKTPRITPEVLGARYPELDAPIAQLYDCFVQIETFDLKKEFPTPEEMIHTSRMMEKFYALVPPPPESLRMMELRVISLLQLIHLDQAFNRQYIYPACIFLLVSVGERMGLQPDEVAGLMAEATAVAAQNASE